MPHCASPSIQFTDDELNLHPSVWLGAGGWGMLGDEVPKESDKSVEETAITEQKGATPAPRSSWRWSKGRKQIEH